MNKNILYLILIVILSSLAFSNEECYINSNCAWYSVITYQPNYYDSDSANITIDNVTHQMQMLQKGIFIYNDTYNMSGVYLGCTQFFNNSVLVGTECETKIIKDGTMTNDVFSFALIIATIFLTIWVLKYLADNLKTEHDILKGLLVLTMILLVILALFISFFMLSGTFSNSIDNLKSNIILIMTIFTSCIVGYILYYFMKRIEKDNKSKYNTISDVNGKQ